MTDASPEIEHRNQSSIFRSGAKYIFGILTTFLTFIAAYELLSENRSVPYLSAELEVCDHRLDAKFSDEANIFFLSNFENTIYVDFLLYEDCYINSPISVSTEPASGSDASVNVIFRRELMKEAKLSFAGEPGLDVDAERLRGVFFLKGEIEGGIYWLDALPVPYSPDMQRKYTCTKSLVEASRFDYFKQAETYVRSCIFEQPWDYWP